MILFFILSLFCPMSSFGLPNDLLQAVGVIDVAFSFSLFPGECYLCDWLKNAYCSLTADDNKSRSSEEHCVTTQKSSCAGHK